jgi:hypothetical protein
MKALIMILIQGDKVVKVTVLGNVYCGVLLASPHIIFFNGFPLVVFKFNNIVMTYDNIKRLLTMK